MEKEISYNQIVQNIKLIYSSGKLSDYLILAGGIVPYLIFNQNSNRLHSDIDFICKIEDIDKIKDIFTSYGHYEREFDSLNILKKDYGFEMFIDNIKVGVYPFEYSDGIIQYSYDSKTKEGKIKNINLDYDDYISSNKDFKYMSLEVILKSKVLAFRQKDIYDIDFILKHDINHKLYSKINIERK